MNYSQTVNFVMNASFFKNFPKDRIFRSFSHMYRAADGIQIIFPFVSGK